MVSCLVGRVRHGEALEHAPLLPRDWDWDRLPAFVVKRERNYFVLFFVQADVGEHKNSQRPDETFRILWQDYCLNHVTRQRKRLEEGTKALFY